MFFISFSSQIHTTPASSAALALGIIWLQTHSFFPTLHVSSRSTSRLHALHVGFIMSELQLILLFQKTCNI